MENLIWSKIEDTGRDAYTFEISVDQRFYIARPRTLSWKERLLSWPWKPWVSRVIGEPERIL